jgi:hypothetical protein
VPSDVRLCGSCGQRKPASDFAWRRRARDQRDNYCRPCRAAYKRQHYAANRESYIANARDRKRTLVEERASQLLAFFGDQPCVDCGERDPLVLEFDHVADKSFNISKGIRDRAWHSVLDEIGKCEVVCANCHRRRTALRGGFARAVVAQR